MLLSPESDLPSWSAPGDATFQSLIAGILFGLCFAFATLVAMTHTAAQWAAIAAQAYAHAPHISSAITAAIAIFIFVQIGCRKWKQYDHIRAEVRQTP